MSETFLRAFHAARPGVTAAAFARTDSYRALAARVATARRVLDLGGGDGPLLAWLPDAISVDLSLEEAARAPAGRGVQGRAHELSFRDGAFDACACHLAFMLFGDIERVVRELARVIAPGGTFAAVLGGGPTADGEDAFHRFLAIARPHVRPIALGDRRASSEAGWRTLFADGWRDIHFERRALDLGGTFDEVWTFLGASYQLDPVAAPHVRAELHAMLGDTAACRVVTWLATVIRR